MLTNMEAPNHSYLTTSFGIRRLLCCLALLFAFTTTTGCDDQDTGTKKTQEVFFEVTYINNAWGHQFKGFLIDKNGKIQTFDNPTQWIIADPQDGLTMQQFVENLAKTKESSVQVSVGELEQYAAKIGSLGNANFSKPVPVSVDGGITTYTAYQLSADRQRYLPVLLMQTGDLEIHNLNPAAQETAVWLAGLAEKVY
ncbi:hypothetical protein ASG33_21470 [Dyadobacter sp. Leaf189]|nr:hypothetical protein ASG33_21470 [Dyadobacter sp. Leaf189]